MHGLHSSQLQIAEKSSHLQNNYSCNDKLSMVTDHVGHRALSTEGTNVGAFATCGLTNALGAAGGHSIAAPCLHYGQL